MHRSFASNKVLKSHTRRERAILDLFYTILELAGGRTIRHPAFYFKLLNAKAQHEGNIFVTKSKVFLFAFDVNVDSKIRILV